MDRLRNRQRTACAARYAVSAFQERIPRRLITPLCFTSWNRLIKFTSEVRFDLM